MRSDEDSSETNPSDPQFTQTAVSGVTARDIQIGQIVQKIVYLGLPFNSRHLRFVQLLANLAYLACLIWGFVRLWQNGADFTTLLLLIVGSGLLSLTCLYYAWFWKPEVQDKSAPSSELPDADERVKKQQVKHRSRQRTRRLAIIGIFAIPLLTWGGFLGWRSLPSTHVLLLVADFDGVDPQKYQVTENILRNLRKATEPYADVEVQALNRTITEQQGSEFSRAAGKQKKASIVIWGEYGVTSDYVQVSTYFEVLKPPANFPELEKTASGEAQTSAIAELNSFKLQTRLSNEMTYLTLFTLGMVQYAKEDWDGAIVRFKSALDQVKEPVTTLGQEVIYFYRGACYYYKHDYKNAIADYNQALKLKPGFANAYTNRGSAYGQQGNSTQAIADFTQALKLKSDFAEAYNNRGNAYNDQDNYTQAIADYTQALKLKSDYAVAYNNRGNAYSFQGNSTQAIADYTQALKLDPDFTGAYNNRGNAYSDQGNSTQAIADYTQALKLKSDYAVAYYNRGMAYHKQGKYNQAIADFSQVLRLKPDYSNSKSVVRVEYASSLSRQDAQFKNQIGLMYSQVLRLKPDYAKAHHNRGVAYYNQGKYTQAIADFTQALKLKPDYAKAYYNKACAHSLKKEVKEAIENLQRAIDLDAKYRETAKTDSDLDNIRQDQQFQALVGK